MASTAPAVLLLQESASLCDRSILTRLNTNLATSSSLSSTAVSSVINAVQQCVAVWTSGARRSMLRSDKLLESCVEDIDASVKVLQAFEQLLGAHDGHDSPELTDDTCSTLLCLTRDAVGHPSASSLFGWAVVDTEEALLQTSNILHVVSEIDTRRSKVTHPQWFARAGDDIRYDTGYDTGGGTVDDTASGDGTGDDTGDDTGDGTGNDTGDDVAYDTGDGTGDDTAGGDGTGDDTGTVDGTGDDTASGNAGVMNVVSIVVVDGAGEPVNGITTDDIAVRVSSGSAGWTVTSVSVEANTITLEVELAEDCTDFATLDVDITYPTFKIILEVRVIVH